MSEDLVKKEILEILSTIYDPEIPVDLVALGLIYDINVTGKHARVQMTLTNPACPVAAQFPEIVKMHLAKIEAIDSMDVEIVWDPPWTPDRMSDEAKFKLGLL